MSVLLPRLSGLAAETLLDRILEADNLRWSGFDATNLPAEARFASTGGSRVDPRELRQFREGLVSIAREHGFGAGSKGAFSKFDAALSKWLFQQQVFQSGEALRDDVWSFVGLVVAPDIVHWRFGSSRERYLGGIRNTFQRLWFRARCLDRGADAEDRWGLLVSLTEDALVQITERPSIGADAVLARALGEAWVRASSRIGRGRMEDVMRLAILRLRIRNEIRGLSLLPEQELAHLLDELFDTAAQALGESQRFRLLDPPQDAADVIPSTSSDHPAPESTRRRSWAIWRAR